MIVDEAQHVYEAPPIARGAAGYRKFRKMNRPQGPFVWFTRQMLESWAWQAMPLAARRVIDRVMIEHTMHGGTRNGQLIVTYDDLAKFGVRRKSIPSAIHSAVTLGFLDVTSRGGRSYGIARRPSTYGLTWLPRCDWTPPSDRWRSIASAEEAARALDGCRRNS